MSDLSQSAFLNLRFNHFYSYSDYNKQINCCKPKGIQWGPTGPTGPIGATGGYGPTGPRGSIMNQNFQLTNNGIIVEGIANFEPYTISLEAINDGKVSTNTTKIVTISGDQFLKSINTYGYFKIPNVIN